MCHLQYNLKKKDPVADSANKYARKGTGPNQTSSSEDKASEDAGETESASEKKSSQGMQVECLI